MLLGVCSGITTLYFHQMRHLPESCPRESTLAVSGPHCIMKHVNMHVNQNKAKCLILTICNQAQMQVLQISSRSVCLARAAAAGVTGVRQSSQYLLSIPFQVLALPALPA